MPTRARLTSFLERLATRYPQAADLGEERILAGRSIFFRGKRILYNEGLVFAALSFARSYAHEVGEELELTDRETRIWQRWKSSGQMHDLREL